MTLWFRDNQKKLRAIECEYGLEVLEDQQSLKQIIYGGSNILAASPILAVVSEGG